MQTYVTERGAHNDGLVTVLFVVVEDLFHGLNTWVFVTLVVLSGSLLVPVENLRLVDGLSKHPNVLIALLTRPTNGEIRVTPASAHATACGKPKRRVKLV